MMRPRSIEPVLFCPVTEQRVWHLELQRHGRSGESGHEAWHVLGRVVGACDRFSAEAGAGTVVRPPERSGCQARCPNAKLGAQSHVRHARFTGKPEMSDTGLTVPSMAEPPSRYDVTVTVARDDGCLPDPAAFAVAAEQAASSMSASVVSAHTAEQIISVVTVLAVDQPAAVAVALAVVSDALKRPMRHPPVDRTDVADLVRRLVEPDVPMVLSAARPVPQRHVYPRPARNGGPMS